MSIMNGQHHWPPPSGIQVNGVSSFHFSDDAPPRTQTPTDNSQPLMPEASHDAEEDRQRAHLAQIFRQSEAKIALLFGDDGDYDHAGIESLRRPVALSGSLLPPATDHTPIEERPAKRAKRVIDEDDYGDDDDEDDDEDEEQKNGSAADPNASSFKFKSAQGAGALPSPSKSGSSPIASANSPGRQLEKTSEDARKQLEEARNATEEAAKRSFHTMFYTLENDRTAMLEQQQLEESEKQLQAEIDKNNHANAGSGVSVENHGTLSSANLGASSLTLKHLIARIDMKRELVKASDAELRVLMNEVRKNRSKWASEENVNQEELYEAVEKVLTELKAHTEYSTPFLQRVNKRDAPDYYSIITKPMDLGTMTKKLKTLSYKSKAEFVADLNLIWDNCLKYNKDMNNPLRRLANGMRKEAEKLIPLIPDLVIRPRAEVEAEERRKQNGDDDAGEDSDDEPIMSSRGRIAGGAKGTKSRKTQSDQKEGTPGGEQKPVLQLNGLLKVQREGSEIEGSNGFGTPPVAGSMTPIGLNGQSQSGIGSNVDAMDIDGPSLNGMVLNQALNEVQEQVFEDEEYKIYKQITKKDRAQIAKTRHQLFKDRKLNADEPALLRTRAGMRRALRLQQQQLTEANGANSPTADPSSTGTKDPSKPSETLAEGMEEVVERVVPDWYDPQSLIPDIPAKLQWHIDSEGHVINQHEEFLRTVRPGYFLAPKGHLSEKFDANLRQMQETRKLCSKISVVKQMQIQTQVYQNQFPKYNPEPFSEQDIEPHVTCGDDVVMAPETCRATLQRAVAKVFYHAGFEEMQPSAMDTVTDIAADYFGKLINTFKAYSEVEKKDPTPQYAMRGARAQPRYTDEEVLLHTLDEHGYDVEALESYAKDEVDRLGNKLTSIHDRMKVHLSDLLRPALNDSSTTDGGAAAFNDGSEQFVGGDFAEELGEDFFGFRELGLSGELGGMLSVPLHLLQSRVRNQYQSQNPTAEATDTVLFEDLAPQDAVTKENIHNHIGLVKNFFLAKLHANGDAPLVEDEDLPVKQRRPRPRLGATGKIVSPQKRPPKEQNAINKKKKKMEAAAAAAAAAAQKANGGADKDSGGKKPAKSEPTGLPNGVDSSLGVAPAESQGGNSQADKDDVGIPSPESMEH